MALRGLHDDEGLVPRFGVELLKISADRDRELLAFCVEVVGGEVKSERHYSSSRQPWAAMTRSAASAPFLVIDLMRSRRSLS